jgi:hypothetical protein
LARVAPSRRRRTTRATTTIRLVFAAAATQRLQIPERRSATLCGAQRVSDAQRQYGKFPREEFLPMNVLGNYDIVIDADGWALAGHSSGGIASIIAGFYHSDRWHKILTASPSFPNKGGKLSITCPVLPISAPSSNTTTMRPKS